MVFQLGVFNFNEGSNLHLPGHSYTRNYLVIADIQRAFYFVSWLFYLYMVSLYYNGF